MFISGFIFADAAFLLGTADSKPVSLGAPSKNIHVEYQREMLFSLPCLIVARGTQIVYLIP